jgi:UDP-galactopyranose mutase
MPSEALQATIDALFDRLNSQTGSKLRWANPERTHLDTQLPGTPDLICLSHLRWDFVYQRPQHLLSRCVQHRRVLFIEEPVPSPEQTAYLQLDQRECGVWVVIPHLPTNLSEAEITALQKHLLDELLNTCAISEYILWYYTPMAMAFTQHLQPIATVYDCMDELSAFKGASPVLREHESELFLQADLVFTGGQSLYEAKCHQHPQVYAFPSSIEAAHFAQARSPLPDPADQAAIAHPRIGFYGVIDERMDLELLDGVAQARPDWQLVMIGPVVKIDPATLPRHVNLHYLGGKSYQELPSYLAGWDVAMLPFARNESTRFISPTKTPEYLAAGKPVVSTSIRDVVRPYGEQGLVQIADTVTDFVAAIEVALQQAHDLDWQARVDAFLSTTSWDRTWMEMQELIEQVMAGEIDVRLVPQLKQSTRSRNRKVMEPRPKADFAQRHVS